jgi:hypothetical protein
MAKGDVLMTTPRPTLTQLAQHAAAQIGFTARRWWRDTTEPFFLRVEVERRLVGAPPAVAELRVPLPSSTRPPRTRSKSLCPPTRPHPLTRRSSTPKGKRQTSRTRTR